MKNILYAITFLSTVFSLNTGECAKNKKEEASTQGELNPLGIVFGYQVMGKASTAEGSSEDINLFANNLPQGQEFVLMGKTFTEKEIPLYDLKVNEQGQLFTTNDKGVYTLPDIRFRLGKFRKGEPYQYILASKDGQTRISTTVVPLPIETFGKNNSRLSVIIASTDAKSFLVQGEGFEPGEKVKLRAKSDGQKINKTLTADENGRISMPFTPGIRWRRSGEAEVSLSTKSDTLKLDFNWGRSALLLDDEE